MIKKLKHWFLKKTCHHHNDTKIIGKNKDGASIIACVRCGEVWNDYSQICANGI